MKRILNKETTKYIGKKVKVAGWVDSIRSHGKIVFIDLRDTSGLLQMVAKQDIAKDIRPEWVIEVEGKISKRPDKMIKSDLETGTVELSIDKIEVLSEAETLPIPINTDGLEISEDKRMKYRYLDLRRARMKRNIEKRYQMIKFMRDYLNKEGFIEIETPMLTKSTPEGARDFVVPSRIYPNKFYALPQSPQQYKQLLQIAGFEKYFQIARCLRDEDSRGDRQPEHTQLDLEMSFVEQEDVMALIEKLFIDFVQKLYPEKKIQEIPFPRITYQEAMSKYKSDRPDMRNPSADGKKDPNLLAFCWVIDFPFFEKTDKGGWTFTHNPFSAPKSEFMEDLLKQKNVGNILTSQYDIVLNGSEVGGGSIRNHQSKALESVFEIIGYKKEEIKNNFGHMLEAFKYGVPPHGGIASGLDRLLTMMLGEDSIREVIAFPKTGDSRDLMMDSPSEISKDQLKELHLK
ncbi:aspartate--tRNA ligase [Patescibacteria group bacterium]|nr:aspartate--tRNA ligase [Patescibacteria group bacterium]